MKRFAPFMVCLAGILWGTIGIFVRTLTKQGLSSMDIVSLRAIVTAVVLFICLLIFKPSLLKVRLRDLWCFVGTGLVSVVFFNFCYFSAIDTISLAVAAVLLYTAPAFVLLMSAVLFKERITGRKIFSLIAVVVGCALVSGIVGQTIHLNAKGFMLGLGAGIGYALYSIFGRYALNRGYESITITFYTFLIASLGTLPLIHLKRMGQYFVTDITTVAFCLLFGILTTVLPYILYTWGLREMDNSKAAVIASIEPITATLIGLFRYHETLGIGQVLGIVLVLGAMLPSEKKKKQDASAS